MAARNQLESYVFGVKHAAEQVPANKLSQYEKDQLMSKCYAAGGLLLLIGACSQRKLAASSYINLLIYHFKLHIYF